MPWRISILPLNYRTESSLNWLSPFILQYFMQSILPPIQDLTEEKLMNYVEHFLDIADFRTIENGRMLLSYIRDNPQHPKIKTIVRKIIGLFNTDTPGAKVCSLQFMKQAMECDNWIVVEAVQKNLLPKVTEIIEYRSHIRSIQRGASYFVSGIDKNTDDEDMVNLVKLSSTFFRMIHQCVYIWGAYYFPGSAFDKLRIRLQKRFDFPDTFDQFRFFNQKKIEQFKEKNVKVQKKMAEKKQQIASQSSIQKKRQTSIKPSRVSSSLQQNVRSQSTDQFQLKTIKSTKQVEKELNKTLKKQESMKSEKKFPHKPKKRQMELQVKLSPRENKKQGKMSKQEMKSKKEGSSKQISENISQNNSFKLSKKNSLTEMIEERQKETKIEQAKYRPIAEDIESDEGWQQMEPDQFEPSQQSSELTEVQYEHTHRSQEGFFDNLTLKKHTSEQIPIQQQAQSLKQVIKDKFFRKQPHKKQVQHKEEKTKKEEKKYSKKNSKEKIPHLPIDQAKKQHQNVVIQDVTTSHKKSSREDALKSKRSTARKKFYSSSEDEKQSPKSKKGNKYETPIKQKSPQKAIRNEQQQPDSIEQIILEKKEKNIAKQSKVSKPKKIKAEPSKSVFESVPEYNIVSHSSANIASKTGRNESKKALQVTSLDSIANKEENLQRKNQMEEIQLNVKEVVNQLDEEIKKDSGQKQQITKKQSSKNIKSKNKEIPSVKQTFDINEVEQIPEIKQIPLGQQVKQEKKKNVSLSPQYQRIESTSAKKEIQNQTVQLSKKKDQSKLIKQQSQKKSEKAVPMNTYTSPAQPQQQSTFRTLLEETPNNYQKSQSVEYQRPFQNTRNPRKNRFQKYSQVSLSISPSQVYNSEMDSRILRADAEQLKQTLQQQLQEEFSSLKTTLLLKQKEAITENIQDFKNKFVREQKPKEDIGIQCSMPSKFKTKVKFYRKKRFLDQEKEDTHSKAQKSESVAIQTSSRQEANKKNELSNISNQLKRQGSLNAKKSSKMNNGEYEPNTLLYALYRKKSMNI